MGNVYFSEIRSFRENKPDSRIDVTEGCTSYTHNGIHYTKELGNSIYIYCTSTENNSELKTLFGQYVVEISDYSEFINQLNISLKGSNQKCFLGINSKIITYNKGSESDHPITSFDGLYTKPEKYEHEKEYRFSFLTPDEFDENKKFIYKECLTLKIDSTIARKILKTAP